MNKDTFLNRLRHALKGLSDTQQDDIVADYRAHFEEAEVRGRNERETAQALGSPEALAAEYLKDRFAFDASHGFLPVRLAQGLLASCGLLFLLPLAGAIVALTAVIAIATLAGIVGILVGSIASIPGISATMLGLLLIVIAGSAAVRRIQGGASPRRDDDTIEQELDWTPGPEMTIALGAEIHWRPAAEARAVVRGAPWVLEHLRLDDTQIYSPFKWRFFRNNHIHVELEGPPIEKWMLLGSGALHLHDLEQPKLDLSVEGSGDITATGTIDQAAIAIRGTGEIDIGKLVHRSVTAEITGMGDATIAPVEEALLAISGSGDIRLLTRPARIETKVTGGGDIRLADGSLLR